MNGSVHAAPSLLTVGRISVDIYGREPGAGLADEQTFAKALGGSPTNVAVAAARLGHHAAVWTKVGDDALGAFCQAALRRLGVDPAYAGSAPGRTPVVVAGLADPGSPDFVFYRDADAPDLQLVPQDIDERVLHEAGILWVTGSCFSREPCAGTVRWALATRGRRSTVLDLDYRPSFWAAREQAVAGIGAAVDLATVTVGNVEECSVATGLPEDAGADALADALLARGVELAVVKRGGSGVLVATADGRTSVPGLAVEVVCGLGAGDAFGGALVHGLLSGWSPDVAVRYANAAGALVASRLLCSEAMPTDDEVRALLGPDDGPGDPRTPQPQATAMSDAGRRA